MYTGYIPTVLKMLRYPSVKRSKATPAVNTFSSKLQFTTDRKRKSAKEVRLNYYAVRLQMTLEGSHGGETSRKDAKLNLFFCTPVNDVTLEVRKVASAKDVRLTISPLVQVQDDI